MCDAGERGRVHAVVQHRGRDQVDQVRHRHTQSALHQVKKISYTNCMSVCNSGILTYYEGVTATLLLSGSLYVLIS